MPKKKRAASTPTTFDEEWTIPPERTSGPVYIH